MHYCLTRRNNLHTLYTTCSLLAFSSEWYEWLYDAKHRFCHLPTKEEQFSLCLLNITNTWYTYTSVYLYILKDLAFVRMERQETTTEKCWRIRAVHWKFLLKIYRLQFHLYNLYNFGQILQAFAFRIPLSFCLWAYKNKLVFSFNFLIDDIYSIW